jgi:hypothetical protein
MLTIELFKLPEDPLEANVPEGTRRPEARIVDDVPGAGAWVGADEGLNIGVGVEIETRGFGFANGSSPDPSIFRDAREPMTALKFTRVLLPRVDILMAEDVKIESEWNFR